MQDDKIKNLEIIFPDAHCPFYIMLCRMRKLFKRYEVYLFPTEVYTSSFTRKGALKKTYKKLKKELSDKC